VTVSALIEHGDLVAGETLTSVRKHAMPSGVLNADGTVDVANVIYRSLSAAAQASSGKAAEPGWDYWTVERDGEPVSLLVIRQRYIAATAATATDA
jgi:hypothetical protein